MSYSIIHIINTKFYSTISLIICLFIISTTTDSSARRRRRNVNSKQRKIAQQAAKLFKKGNQLFEDRDYVGALDAFESADKLKPHFIMKCNIAKCYQRLTNMIRAVEFYKRCLSEGANKKRETANRVRKELAAVEARITWVRVESKKVGIVFVDGKRKGETPIRVPLNPGQRSIEVRRSGAKPASTLFTTRGGEDRTIELNPVDFPKRDQVIYRSKTNLTQTLQEKEDNGISPAWFWVGTAITTGLAVGGVITGISALGAKSDYEKNPTRQGYYDAQDKRTLANILWAATAASALTTTTLFFFTDFGGDSDDVKKNAKVIGIGIRGSF